MKLMSVIRYRIPQKGDRTCHASSLPETEHGRPSTAQLVFLVLTIVIILSFVLSLFVQV